ncbi:V8-like Glu-specific endopeptidase [Allocatelliglobosispora scoriae]|uniref:V8-like Glu-specific endopeptidase n=1 Tax=Allocatelliglobosispora scoriae TaxID=643052 RepID=A0A841BG19_9ACTN|nr:trypsin-like serine protease [Allocatelliglobosispora scoriae]MBB5867234.1 V8-like Glu-specific endopeptidase [Allocatelliglobosispora scoriae]
MRRSRPLNITRTSSPDGGQDAGTPRTIAPRAAVPQLLPSPGLPWTSAGIATKTTGKVFFKFGSSDYTCSAAAVTSANKSTVMTAGHCILEHPMFGTARYAANWIFAPAYANGSQPYGAWTASILKVSPQWLAGDDFNYDFGAAVVSTLGGTSLQDTVGAQGIAFSQPRPIAAYVFGYPSNFSGGQSLTYCSGPTVPDVTGRANAVGMLCSMSNGSSGGPWLYQFSEATGAGYLNSVTSFKYAFGLTLFGSYFGTAAETFYDSVQAL